MIKITSRIRAFPASDGYRLHFRAYVPETSVKGHLVCLHGIQSHGGWYEASCQKLSEAGYIVSYLDRRGSGLNWLARGDAPSYSRLLDDVREFIRTDGLDVPVTLIATSWAGKLGVLLAAEEKPVMDRLVLLCPGLFPKVKPTLAVRLGIAAARFTHPTKMFPIPLNDPEWFTAHPGWVDFLRNDPLAIHQATSRLLVESFWIDRAVKKITCLRPMPTLLMLAGKDRIIRNDVTRKWLEEVMPGCKVIEYPEAHHTLEFEPGLAFVDDLLTWLQS